MIIHNAVVSVFAYPEDDIELVKECLIKLVPFKARVEQKTAQGFNERVIKIFRIVVDKRSECREFLNNLLNLLRSSQKSVLLSQIESRLDDELFFYIRFDKSAWVDGKLWLTDSGDCFHIKLSVAAFPKKREVALKMLEDLFRKDF